jgi:hypothetical protein
MRLIVPAAIIAIVAILIALLAMNEERYPFIETQTYKNGTIINGTPGMLFIDAPTYILEDSTLTTTIGVELNSSTKAIYGDEYQISGDIGSGISGELYPVRDLPYNYGEIEILKIEGDNVTLDCYGENVTLMPGSSWKGVTTRPEMIGERLFNVTTTVTVYNHGKVTVKVRR